MHPDVLALLWFHIAACGLKCSCALKNEYATHFVLLVMSHLERSCMCMCIHSQLDFLWHAKAVIVRDSHTLNDMS